MEPSWHFLIGGSGRVSSEGMADPLRNTDLKPFSKLRVLISSGAPIFAEECAEICARLTPNFFEYYAST